MLGITARLCLESAVKRKSKNIWDFAFDSKSADLKSKSRFPNRTHPECWIKMPLTPGQAARNTRPAGRAAYHDGIQKERKRNVSDSFSRETPTSAQSLITSRPRARSYASQERKLWWKKFKIKRFASGCDEIWDSRSVKGKDKLSTDPLTAILASLDHFFGIYGASSWNGQLQSPQPSHFSYC